MAFNKVRICLEGQVFSENTSIMRCNAHCGYRIVQCTSANEDKQFDLVDLTVTANWTSDCSVDFNRESRQIRTPD
jgi:hypothetical protein